ncbi:AsmA family protein [Chitiniphilus shinanonensis]|uniref:AsmA family protein n=1 Tax=Chitiniphilus shinanonensis TaxID=553088 RepID=UPI003039F070
MIDRSNWFYRHRIALAVTGTVLALLVAAIALFDWNLLRGPIARRVTAETGRSFAINGDLDVRLSLRPTVTAHDLVLGNAAWSHERTMAHARSLTVQLDLWPLLKGRVVLPQLVLDTPRVLLERNAKGQGNWAFDLKPREAEKDDQGVQIGMLRVQDGLVRYLDPQLKSDVTVKANSRTAGTDTRQSRLLIDAAGRYQDLPLAITGEIGSVTDLQQTLAENRRPYPIAAQGRIGATRVAADGSIANLRQFSGLDANFALSGRSLAELYPLLGVPLPATPAYSVKGHLQHSGEVWDLSHIAGKVGNSDLNGRFKVDRGQQPQFIQADLTSRRLDLKDLSGFLGARDEQSGKTVAVPGSKVLPQNTLNVEKLKVANADVRLKGHRIQTEKLPLDDFEAHLLLKDGVVTLNPLNFGVAGGDLRSTVKLDSNLEPFRTQADVKVRKLQLKRLVPKLDLGEKASVGLVGGWARLDMRGDSVARMAASADGDIALLMHGGSTSKLIMRLANLDVANSLGILLTGDEQIDIRCAVADFEAKDGNLLARTLVLDTEKSVVKGEGTIDLKREQLDLRLRSDPKDISLAALRGPIVLSGPLAKPSVRPSLPQPTGRVAVAAALATISPPLALLPLIELGGAEDTPCAALLKNPRKAGKQLQDKERAAPGAKGTASDPAERQGTWNRTPTGTPTPTPAPALKSEAPGKALAKPKVTPTAEGK